VLEGSASPSDFGLSPISRERVSATLVISHWLKNFIIGSSRYAIKKRKHDGDQPWMREIDESYGYDVQTVGNILLIEDEEGLRMTLSDRLRSQAYVVDLAAEGQEG
jgi:hypothetical protein